MATADQGAEPIDVFSPPGSPRSARHNGSAPARKREPPKIIGGARFEAPRRGANRSASKVNLIMWTRQINQALRGTGTEVTHTTFEGSDGDVRFFVDSKEPEKEPAIHAALHRVMPRSVSIKSSQAVLGTPSVLRNVVSVLITVQHQENCDWWDQWMRLLLARKSLTFILCFTCFILSIYLMSRHWVGHADPLRRVRSAAREQVGDINEFVIDTASKAWNAVGDHDGGASPEKLDVEVPPPIL